MAYTDFLKPTSVTQTTNSETEISWNLDTSAYNVNTSCSTSEPLTSFWLFLAGVMTLIPLFLFLKGVQLSGLGTSGMIFFITPTCQFLLGVFYYNEYFDVKKLIGFIIIWIAVAIYLHDLTNYKEVKLL